MKSHNRHDGMSKNGLVSDIEGSVEDAKEDFWILDGLDEPQSSIAKIQINLISVLYIVVYTLCGFVNK